MSRDLFHCGMVCTSPGIFPKVIGTRVHELPRYNVRDVRFPRGSPSPPAPPCDSARATRPMGLTSWSCRPWKGHLRRHRPANPSRVPLSDSAGRPDLPHHGRSEPPDRGAELVKLGLRWLPYQGRRCHLLRRVSEEAATPSKVRGSSLSIDMATLVPSNAEASGQFMCAR